MCIYGLFSGYCIYGRTIWSLGRYAGRRVLSPTPQTHLPEKEPIVCRRHANCAHWAGPTHRPASYGEATPWNKRYD